jgi:hypothetical protein
MDFLTTKAHKGFHKGTQRKSPTTPPLQNLKTSKPQNPKTFSPKFPTFASSSKKHSK